MVRIRPISEPRSRQTIAKASVHNRCSGVENSRPDNVCHAKYLTRTFFSATSFYPGRVHDVDTQASTSHILHEDDHPTDVHDGDTDVASEEEWVTEPHPVEPAGRTSSKALEVMLVEVSASFFFFFPQTYRYFL